MEEKIQELQFIEQNMQNTLMQKQQFQTELIEIDNALKELSKNPKETYKIIGNIMIATDKKDLKSDLESKKDIIAIRIKNLEKQETDLKEKLMYHLEFIASQTNSTEEVMLKTLSEIGHRLGIKRAVTIREKL